jgi:hypothetical protein
MAFALHNGDVVVSWDDGKVSGFPAEAVADAEIAVGTSGVQAATPTGPFFEQGTPEAALIVLRGMWPEADVHGDAPVLAEQPDELGDDFLQEGIYDEAKHPRGRGGKWTDAVMTTAADAARAAVQGLRAHHAAVGFGGSEDDYAKAQRNFTSAFRGGLSKDRTLAAKVAAALEHNAESPVHRAAMYRHGEDRVAILRPDAKQSVVHPGHSAAHRLGQNRLTVIREDAVDHPSLPRTLRHEFAHSMWSSLSPEEKQRFQSELPHSDEIEKGLSYYAGFKGQVGNAEEAYAELYAEVSDPHHDPAKWPEWVRSMGHEWFGHLHG